MNHPGTVCETRLERCMHHLRWWDAWHNCYEALALGWSHVTSCFSCFSKANRLINNGETGGLSPVIGFVLETKPQGFDQHLGSCPALHESITPEITLGRKNILQKYSRLCFLFVVDEFTWQDILHKKPEIRAILLEAQLDKKHINSSMVVVQRPM